MRTRVVAGRLYRDMSSYCEEPEIVTVLAVEYDGVVSGVGVRGMICTVLYPDGTILRGAYYYEGELVEVEL